MNPNFMESIPTKAKSCIELVAEFRKREAEKEVKQEGVKLKFLGVGSKDVYNVTPPFMIDGVEVIAGRVEERSDYTKSEIYFFKQEDETTWVKIDDTTVLKLEKPFETIIDGENIIGGMKVEDPFITTIGGKNIMGRIEVPSAPSNGGKDSPYHTVFYRGQSLDTLEKFAIGPEKMKDIRIVELENGHIGVFTRPQDGIYKQGKIGYIELDSLEDLNPENIAKAKIIENLFSLSKEGHDEWGGANQLHLLDDGKIGVIGHIAYLDEENKKHYYAMSFIFDPKTHTASPIKIIATRDDFPPGEAKKPDLKDVIFVGGVDKKDGTYYLYAGLGDVESGRKFIDNPF